ncbi:glycosyltransferase family 2 protein [Sporolactobacillus kofuensis]|uniref:Glycosyltransferase family 2 protein n=1 Tax=Sporolactobacillus kofuensis TaxID=269672 RepID=A0ABW1WCG5_9BACL|nr:glycosyltransferase family 2 protein [Sporolactobacillus kofuensis]MCO7174818.1 glycosyltransferase [Sporolactobacillus kofuensis]
MKRFGWKKNKTLSNIEAAVTSKTEEIQQLTIENEETKRRLQLHLQASQEEIAASYERIEKALNEDPQKWTLIKQQIQKKSDHQATFFPHLRIGERLLLLGIITAKQLNQSLKEQQIHGGRLGDIVVRLGYVSADQLKQIIDQSFQRLLLGELLVRSGYLSREELDEALHYQESVGGDIGEILVAMGLITPNQLTEALASQNQTGRLITYDKNVVLKAKLPETVARKFKALVIRHSVDQCIIAVESLLNEEELHRLAKIVDAPITQVLASPWEMELLWDQVYQEELLHESTEKLKNEQPENSASQTFTLTQIIVMIVIGIVIAAALMWNWFYTLVFINIIIQLMYFSMTVTKFVMILYGTKENAQIRFSKQQIQSIDERELPMYTILVPMYKESNVIPQLVRNLNRLDYPKNKLDIRLLIEKDDVEAQEVIQSLHLPYSFQMIIIPDGQPKTKPKACNYGLIRARGKYVVIYDAEDRPDPDQLKKVFLAFQQSPDNTACIQAKLNYFNSKQNLLTKFFTQEYSNWFELLLPGIMQMNIPIPLGGTSNHFKTDMLKKLGAWDPYNVTEDADLGIRLYKQEYSTRVVDSRTLEEANSQFRNWIHQRSRWIKGYMQTWLVHMRHPIRLHRELGIKGFWGAQFMLLSSPLLPMLNPIFWSLLIIWYMTHAGWIPAFFPGIIYYLAAVQLILGNFLFIYTNIAGTYWVVHELYRKKENWLSYSLVRYALLTPIYWGMMSIASIKALWQLIRKPFYWEKTEHGFDQERYDTTKSSSL